MAVLCCVMAKPTIVYNAPFLAEPASAVVESTYHGVSGYYAAPVVTAFASPYLSEYSAYPAFAPTLLR